MRSPPPLFWTLLDTRASTGLQSGHLAIALTVRFASNERQVNANRERHNVSHIRNGAVVVAHPSQVTLAGLTPFTALVSLVSAFGERLQNADAHGAVCDGRTHARRAVTRVTDSEKWITIIEQFHQIRAARSLEIKNSSRTVCHVRCDFMGAFACRVLISSERGTKLKGGRIQLLHCNHFCWQLGILLTAANCSSLQLTSSNCTLHLIGHNWTKLDIAGTDWRTLKLHV